MSVQESTVLLFYIEISLTNNIFASGIQHFLYMHVITTCI